MSIFSPKSIFLGLGLSILSLSSLSVNKAQAIVAGHWTFEAGSELADVTGNFGDLALFGGANVSNGQLDLNANQYAQALNYTGPTITDKTLVSWVYLEDLDVGSGSALTIDSPSVDRFDAIVYAEIQPNRWMPGSTGFSRTQPPVPGFAETSPNQLVQMAITYEDNGGSPDISIYRNGDLIGNYTQGSTASWSAGDAEVIFGARHTNNGTIVPIGTLDARIEEAMIFDEVLNQSQIQALTTSAAVPFEFSPALGILAVGGIFGASHLRKKIAARKLISDEIA